MKDFYFAPAAKNEFFEGNIRLDTLIEAALYFRLPFAVWQLPEQKTICFTATLSGVRHFTLNRLKERGFVVHPFDTRHDDPVFIDAHLFYSTAICRLQCNRSANFNEALFNDFCNRLEERHRQHEINPETDDSWFFSGDHDIVPPDKSVFVCNAEKAVERIRANIFQKVVLSRFKKVSRPENLSITGFFYKLCDRHPGTFKSLISMPRWGTWIGVSPETLVKQDHHNIFYTEALAGTQPVKPGLPIKETLWRQKEIEEQALVSRFIINCFKHIRLRAFSEMGPKTVAAGNVLHLKTRFSVDLNQVDHPGLLQKMLELLHPTSAVCGMPRQEALEFIRQNENFSRQLFSGYIGPANLPDEEGFGKTHLFVNLRCLKVLPDSLVLFAGAGVTEDSEAEQEWEETNFKMETLHKQIREH